MYFQSCEGSWGNMIIFVKFKRDLHVLTSNIPLPCTDTATNPLKMIPAYVCVGVDK